jgi:hypothetical protein
LACSFNLPVKPRLYLIAALWLAFAPAGRAQWLTQSIDLKAGWNAVFLHVDASHDTLNALVAGDIANPILEVWRWNPPSVAQFVDNPANPTPTAEWTSWVRTNSSSALQRLNGDTAYLVRVGTNAPTYTWRVKGRPVPPRHDWTISGLNLVGFPTVTITPPRFDAFLALAPELQSATPEIYYYNGGDLGPSNPLLLPSALFRNTNVRRGQAFWVRSGTVFNRYFGPFEILQAIANGVDFRETLSSATFRLRNLTTNTLTVTLRLTASETPPAGQTSIAGVPPLLLRGTMNQTNLTYGYTNLPVSTARTWTLAARGLPGSEVEVALGLNRAAMTNAPGTLLAGILRFTDSLGHSQVDVPVSAKAVSSAGLWIGGVAVTKVGHYLQSYDRDGNGQPIVSTNGNYIVNGIDTSLGATARPYPLRLIIHNPTNGNAKLLQRVYYGVDAYTNIVVASRESSLNGAYLKDARRISSTHLPWTETNAPWAFNGRLRAQTNLTTVVSLPYDDQAANPFLHTYHPDHDNLDPTFKLQRAQGQESYGVQRSITLQVTPPTDDFSSLVAAGDTITGNYIETIALKGLAREGGTNDTRQFEVRGAFSLNRVSEIPTLTVAP